PLDPTALALLRRYRDFANDTAQEHIGDADKRADTASGDLCRMQLPGLRQAVIGQQDNDAPDATITAALTLVDVLAAAQTVLASRRAIAMDPIREKAAAIQAAIERRHAAAVDLISELSTKAEQRQEALKQAQAELVQLKDRLELKARIGTI